jgi:hypothetical protein
MASAPMMAAFAEPYDGPGSGLVGGLAFGILATLMVATFATILALTNASTNEGFLKFAAGNFWPLIGGLGALALLAGFVGWLLGKRS